MTDNPILKKLRLKDQSPLLVYNPPDEYRPVMAAISGEIHTSPQAKYKFVHVFVKNAAEVAKLAVPAAQSLEGDGYLWISYPKKSSKKHTSDISRDHGWEPLGALGFEPVTQVSINEDWSALRFRKVEDIKTLTRKSALSQQGKKRIAKNEDANPT
jgi:hypothetical protein